MNDQTTLFNDNAEYDAFVEKFKPKKTTDDCYTPLIVYDAVADWVAREYELDKQKFVRPFYPGGDYQAFEYAPDAVVVDNPPFSIITQIKRFYSEHSIKFFLFAPALTLFSGYSDGITLIPVGVAITYENGANVNTSFVTNLDKWQIRTAPALYKAVEKANDENLKSMRRELPKYSYPDEVITSAIVARWCKYGVDFKVKQYECRKIPALDAQKKVGKTVFGSGFLLSERAAAERAAAERAAAERAAAERAAAERAAAHKWTLSDRELAICRELSGYDKRETEKNPCVPLQQL